MHTFAQSAQLLHALDGVLDLILLNDFQFVDVEFLILVSLREKNDCGSKLLFHELGPDGTP